MKTTIISLGLSLLLWLSGCEDTPNEPTPATHTATHAATTPQNTTQTPHVVTQKPPVEVKRPKSEKLVAAMEKLLLDWQQKETDHLGAARQQLDKKLAELKWFKTLSQQAYEYFQFQQHFHNGQKLTPNGQLLLDTISAVEDHALSLKPYQLDTITEAIKSHGQALEQYQTVLTDCRKDPQLWDALVKLRQSPNPTRSQLEQLVSQLSLTDSDVTEVTIISECLPKLFAEQTRLDSLSRDIDIALLQAYYRYIFDMRYRRTAHPFRADKSDGAGVERTKDSLFEAIKLTDFNDFQTALDNLIPKHPFYRKTVAGLKVYRDLRDKGQQTDISSKAGHLRRGRKGQLVTDLQQRLAEEGYYDGEIDGSYGPALENAVEHYQQTHQLKVTKRPSSSMIKSLNIPFSKRVEQIELSLQRYRESDLHQGEWPFGSTEYRASINLPEFVARFFKDGEVVRQHRVVIGSNAIEVDEKTGRRGHFNQTRLFSAEMRTIVLNPTWKVPARIKEQELDMKLLEEPDFYQKHNYSLKILDDGTEIAVQNPGPNNALGLVKFLFPNPFAIYMHDTPKKHFFDRSIRAFSHGCMRTEDPLALAKWILTEVNDMTVDRFEAIMKSREEYGVALKTRIPVTVDYNSVSVYSDGKMMFLSDVYGFDHDYFDNKTPYPYEKDFELTKMN